MRSADTLQRLLTAAALTALAGCSTIGDSVKAIQDTVVTPVANAIAPAARTRLTATIPGSQERDAERAAQAEESGFDTMAPGNVSPMVAYLATEDCPIGGKTFFVFGGTVQLFQPWTIIDTIKVDHTWSLAELAEHAAKWGDVQFDQTISID